QPVILQNSQDYIREKFNITADKPVNSVFHGGSGSSPAEIKEALSYGAIKVNIDTDMQWAFWDGIREYYRTNEDSLQAQNGNSKAGDAPNKKFSDPRVWLRKGEESFVKRLSQAFEELISMDVSRK